VQGLLLSVASPLGWVVIQSANGVDIAIDLAEHSGVYWYMALATALVFSSFGAYLGSREQLLSNISLIDELTGLYNSRFFRERLRQTFAQRGRGEQTLCLVMLDIDHFKQINDKHGHLMGDTVLRSVAVALSASCRGGETASRVGGEELCVILENCSLQRAIDAAERFRCAIASLAVPVGNGETIGVTVSAGVASSGPTSLDGWDIYRAADQAMYRAKRGGRDQTCY